MKRFTQKIVTSFATTGLALAASVFIAGCGGDTPTDTTSGEATPAATDGGGSGSTDEATPAGGSGTKDESMPAGGSGSK